MEIEGRDSREPRNGHGHYLHRPRDEFNLKSPSKQFTDSQSPTATPQPTQIQRNGITHSAHSRDGVQSVVSRRRVDGRSSSDSENVQNVSNRHRDRMDRKREKKKRKRRDNGFDSEDSSKKRRRKASKSTKTRKRKSETKSRGTKKKKKKEREIKEKRRRDSSKHSRIKHQRTYSGSGSGSKLLGTRRRSLTYGSHSNLLGDSSLDNLHKNIEREKKKKKKRKKKKKKDKLTRDANKMYNARYNKMYGIKPQSPTKRERERADVREHQSSGLQSSGLQSSGLQSSSSRDRRKNVKSKKLIQSVHSHSRWDADTHDLMANGLSPQISPRKSPRFNGRTEERDHSPRHRISPYVSPRLSPRHSPRPSPRLNSSANRPRSSRSSRDNGAFRGHGVRPRSSPRGHSTKITPNDHDKLGAFYLSNGAGISKINASASKIGAPSSNGNGNGTDQRSATPTTDAFANIKRRKKHKAHKSFTNKNDFAEFEYKEKTDHHSYYTANMQIGSNSGDIFAEFQEAAESLSRRKNKSKTTAHSHSNSHSRHSHTNHTNHTNHSNHIHSSSHSKHFTPPPPANLDEEQEVKLNGPYSMYTNPGPTGKRRSQKSQRSHRSQRSSSQNMAIHREEYEEKHIEHDYEHKSNGILNGMSTMNGHGPSTKKRRSTSNKNKTPRPDPYDPTNHSYDANTQKASVPIKAFDARYHGNAQHSSYDYKVYDRVTVKSSMKKRSSLKSKHSARPQKAKASKNGRSKSSKLQTLGLHHQNSVASYNSASRNSTGSRNSFGSRTSSAYNHKNLHLTSNGGGAKSIKSNGSPRSITTRSITMVSASEEYSVDNATNVSGVDVRSSYYDNEKSVDEDRYSPKSGKSY